MPTPKGVSGNPKGRPKGVPNKVTADIRETLKAFIDKNLTGMQKNFDKLEPKDKLVFIEKLLPYLVPKLQSTDIDMGLKNLDPAQLDEYLNRLIENQL